MFQTNHEIITFGEMKLIQELKIANDNLRWRCEQKNLLVSKHKETIVSLQNQLKQYDSRLQTIEKENKSHQQSSSASFVSTNGSLMVETSDVNGAGSGNQGDATTPSGDGTVPSSPSQKVSSFFVVSTIV
jgi:hypothetical protein